MRSNDRFQVRMEIYDEGNAAHMFEPGCHVKLESAPAGSENFRQFGNAYYSKCGDIPKDRIRFVNDRTAYVFMQWWYRVSVDGGATWTTWDAPSRLPGRVYSNPKLIEDVSMSANGIGTMRLNPAGVASAAPLELRTTNFGVDWSASQ